MSRAFGHLLTDTVQAATLTGQDPFTGDPIWSDPFPLRCRIEGAMKLVRDATGAEVVSSQQLVTDYSLPTDPARVKVWLPGEDPATAPGHIPKSITTAATLDGRARLYEVAF